MSKCVISGCLRDCALLLQEPEPALAEPAVFLLVRELPLLRRCSLP